MIYRLNIIKFQEKRLVGIWCFPIPAVRREKNLPNELKNLKYILQSVLQIWKNFNRKNP